MDFSKKYYKVMQIDGDYVNLVETDEAGNLTGDMNEPKLVARALVPSDISEGDGLVYEFLSYKKRC